MDEDSESLKEIVCERMGMAPKILKYVKAHIFVGSSMANMTLAIPDQLHKKMKVFSEIRWSEIARKAFEERVADLEAMDRLASKSRLSAKDAALLATKIKKGAARRFLNEHSP